jgi:hypothetical protein
MKTVARDTVPARLRTTAFSLPVLTERPHPTRLFFKNRGPRQASLLGWKNRGPRQASLLGWKNRGPRQASLLGWKKSRTSLPCPVQSRSENALGSNPVTGVIRVIR